MKKTVLLIVLGLSMIAANAQVLSSINFTNYNTQSLGADLTGTLTNQQGWLSYATPNTQSLITDFRISPNGNPGNCIYMIGFDHMTVTGSKFLWKDGFPALWNSRTAGNNTLEFEVDYQRPNTTLSADDIQVIIYDATFTKVLAGYSISETGTIFARMYKFSTTSNSFGNWYYALEDGNFTTLPAMQWMKLILRFNKVTGDVTFIIKNPNGTVFVQKTITGGGAAGVDPAEIDFAIFANTSGVSYPAQPYFDNYKITALANTLAVNEASETAVFSIYPNPASNEITISNERQIGVSGIVITDMNARIVKQIQFDNLPKVQVNIADLSNGVYLMKITSGAGTVTKKIVKH
ncbi:MAG TPA: T9SS type A sorting domain-containing protein [Flavobacterium sp.]|nr:T9SS type A sorting domain-containing protein [Flavobacterium sp.]HPJ11580.1 T9SS type A sorting domain-containing protein [Flavobacterium sp.]